MIVLNFKYLFICSSILYSLSFCTQSAKKRQMSETDNSNIRSVDVTDTSYLQAIKVAQDNMDLFIKLFQDRTNNKFRFSIKKKFIENDIVEHMWSTPELFTGGTFVAILDNIPKNIFNLKYKDTLTIHQQEVEDWMIFDGDSLVLGNFIFNGLQE